MNGPVNEQPSSPLANASGRTNAHALQALATDENFDERAYLLANADVAAAVHKGDCRSGRAHFDNFGRTEGRSLRLPVPSEQRREKLLRLRPLLREDAAIHDDGERLDGLNEALRTTFAIVPTHNVSGHSYDARALELIERHADGLVLDCGAGQRDVYYANVVNYEVVAYDSTDVLGVAERLPFKDDSFDAVLSLSVLEHVKDPFQAARELMRVLKPGGELMCVAPFLQPLHGYPHHYYNMTAQGLRSLFEPLADVRVEVYGALRPLWSLHWLLGRYLAGLPHDQREGFSALSVAELLAPLSTQETRPYVLSLDADATTAIASAHALFACKPIGATDMPSAPPVTTATAAAPTASTPTQLAAVASAESSLSLCPICDLRVDFFAPDDYWTCRELLKAPACPMGSCITRERALARALFSVHPRERIGALAIHEATPAGRGLSLWLQKNCAGYVKSGYYPDRTFGEMVGRLRNEDLHAQTFADASFDLVLHLDVLEHLLDPFLALREIHRTLKPGGYCMFTAPTYAQREKSEPVAFVKDDGTLRILGTPEYHGNPQDPGGGALVTWRYGYDLPLLIMRNTGFDVEVRRWQSRHDGIMGLMTETYILRRA